MRTLDRSKFFGVTHDADGELSAKVPRVVKVSIGLAKGKDIHVLIGPDRKWYVKAGEKRVVCDTKDQARAAYKDLVAKCAERKFPKKIGYFTFTRNNADNVQEPDFDLIERFGSMPTELDVVFLNNCRHYNFDRGMKMYSKSQLLCEGNGLDALRSCSIARTPEEKKLADAAAREGEKYFPILGGCYSKGCHYSKPSTRNSKECPAECKPHGTLRFQLCKAPMLGGDCYLTTTSLRSISNLEASLDQLAELTGEYVKGVPLLMQLRPYNTPKGMSYSVAITMSAASLEHMTRKLHSGEQIFKRIEGPAVTEAPPAPVATEEQAAQLFNAEYVVNDESDEEPPLPPDDGATEAEFEEPGPTPEKPASTRLTLEALGQEQRDTVLQAGRKLGMNRARIEAFLGEFTGTAEQAIAELTRQLEAKK